MGKRKKELKGMRIWRDLRNPRETFKRNKKRMSVKDGQKRKRIRL